MVILLGSLQLGILYGMLALGIYITFRIMNVPDLTAEGSFTLGLALSAVLTIQGHPLLGLAAALLAGAAAGMVTGLRILAGDSSYLSGILTMSGLYSVNLLAMGNSSNLSLINSTTIFKMASQFTAVFRQRYGQIVSGIIIYGSMHHTADLVFQNPCWAGAFAPPEITKQWFVPPPFLWIRPNCPRWRSAMVLSPSPAP